jgi:SAM-dependent methyltransferase
MVHRRRTRVSRDPMVAVFSAIYHDNAWSSKESLSGPGSELAPTTRLRAELPMLTRELSVRSLLDAPCGDFHWMREVRLDLDRYIGVDIVPELIRANQRKYGDGTRRFICLDITRDELPQADLILCRDCLVHLSFPDIASALRKFQESGSAYLLTTTFAGLSKNAEIMTGDWRPIEFQLPPFNFPMPTKLIREGVDLSDELPEADKCLGLWRLADIPLSAIEETLSRAGEFEYYESPWRQRAKLAAQELSELLPAGETFILVDEGKWGADGVVPGHGHVPFLERDGQYWGVPPDDETAIKEMERLRQSGARYMVFAWPAFWWLDYYSGLRRYLRAQFRCIHGNESLMVFDLYPQGN